MQELLKISEAAEMLGVSASTLREWEPKGILTPVGKTESGHRLYSKEHIKRFMINPEVNSQLVLNPTNIIFYKGLEDETDEDTVEGEIERVQKEIRMLEGYMLFKEYPYYICPTNSKAGVFPVVKLLSQYKIVTLYIWDESVFDSERDKSFLMDYCRFLSTEVINLRDKEEFIRSWLREKEYSSFGDVHEASANLRKHYPLSKSKKTYYL